MSTTKITNENFNELVLKGTKPALVEFSAPWCVYCRRIGPAFSKIAEQYADTLTVGEINIDEEPVLAVTHKVEVIPTMMLFRDGKLLASITAPESKARIEEFIRENLGE